MHVYAIFRCCLRGVRADFYILGVKFGLGAGPVAAAVFAPVGAGLSDLGLAMSRVRGCLDGAGRAGCGLLPACVWHCALQFLPTPAG